MTIPQIFISHDSDDRDFVEHEIIAQIERLNLATWYSARDIHPTEKWELAIRKGLETSDWFLVVVSKESIASLFVTAEVQWAVTHRWGKMAIVLKDDSDPSQLHITFGQLQYIDYGKSYGTARQKLDDWLRSIITDSQPKLLVNIVGARGGVGKSTITCRMAELVAESGSNALIIDLDTSTGGSTSLQRERGYHGRSSSTYSLLEALAQNINVTPQPITLLDVTPDYLKERQHSGQVFLLPAAPLENVARPPTIHLIHDIIFMAKRDQSQTNLILENVSSPPVAQDENKLGLKTASDDEVIAKVMSVILSAADFAPVPVHCVFIDCGAEGPEFNALIDASHHVANVTYIVVQPDASSRGNLTRVGTLLTRGPHGQTAHKLRVIINRVASPDQEENVRGQFADYQISGIIPYDSMLFEDVQRGRVNNFYRYDSITRAIHKILDNDFPITLVPKEADLWIHAVVEKLLQRPPLEYLKNFLARESPTKWIIGFFFFFLGVIICGIQVLKIFINSSGNNDIATPHYVEAGYVIAAILATLLLLFSIRKLNYIWVRVRLLSDLANLQQSDDPQQEMEKYLLEISRSDSKLALLDWLRTTLVLPPKRQHSLSLLDLLRQLLKR